MTQKIAILPGDGIGPEIIAQAVRVLDKLIEQGLDVQYSYAPLGGAAYDEYGHPYPEFTQKLLGDFGAKKLLSSSSRKPFLKVSSFMPMSRPSMPSPNQNNSMASAYPRLIGVRWYWSSTT